MQYSTRWRFSFYNSKNKNNMNPKVQPKPKTNCLFVWVYDEQIIWDTIWLKYETEYATSFQLWDSIYCRKVRMKEQNEMKEWKHWASGMIQFKNRFYHFTFVFIVIFILFTLKNSMTFLWDRPKWRASRDGVGWRQRQKPTAEKTLEKCARDYSSHHSFISSFLWVPILFFSLFLFFCYSSASLLSLLLLLLSLSLKSTVLRLLLEWSAHQRFSHWKFFLQMVSL